MDSQELIDKNIALKITLLGESQVGKTSIINRYIGQDFKEEYKPSLSGYYNKKYFDYESNEKFLDIWDTSGNENLKPLNKVFIKKAKGVIFVYDITNKESFDKLKYWVKEAHDQAGEFKSIVFGNKSDLYTDQKVSEEEGKKLANEIGANFCLVSAKDNINIKEGFENLIDQILPNRYFKKENSYKLQNNEKNTGKRKYGDICGTSQKRELTNQERCLTCCGYYACKDCLETGCDTCSDCCCGETKCSKESCGGCFGYIICGLCYCCCGLNVKNDAKFACCCCCHCPKEGAVSVYGE